MIAECDCHGCADTCVLCKHPVRPLPNPIPEGTEVMLTEAILGKAVYCQQHFDEMKEKLADSDAEITWPYG